MKLILIADLVVEICIAVKVLRESAQWFARKAAFASMDLLETIRALVFLSRSVKLASFI